MSKRFFSVFVPNYDGRELQGAIKLLVDDPICRERDVIEVVVTDLTAYNAIRQRFAHETNRKVRFVAATDHGELERSSIRCWEEDEDQYIKDVSSRDDGTARKRRAKDPFIVISAPLSAISKGFPSKLRRPIRYAISGEQNLSTIGHGSDRIIVVNVSSRWPTGILSLA